MLMCFISGGMSRGHRSTFFFFTLTATWTLVKLHWWQVPTQLVHSSGSFIKTFNKVLDFVQKHVWSKEGKASLVEMTCRVQRKLYQKCIPYSDKWFWRDGCGNKQGGKGLSLVYTWKWPLFCLQSPYTYLKNLFTYLDVMNCFCCHFSSCAMIFPVTVDISHSFQNLEDWMGSERLNKDFRSRCKSWKDMGDLWITRMTFRCHYFITCVNLGKHDRCSC